LLRHAKYLVRGLGLLYYVLEAKKTMKKIWQDAAFRGPFYSAVFAALGMTIKGLLEGRQKRRQQVLVEGVMEQGDRLAIAYLEGGDAGLIRAMQVALACDEELAKIQVTLLKAEHPRFVEYYQKNKAQRSAPQAVA
jgi:hypothetical protein